MLKGDLINLRTMKQEDLEEIYTLSSDLSERGEYWPSNISSEPVFRKRFAETGFWNEDFVSMVITDKTNRILGEVNYFKGLWYMPGYEIGYQLYLKSDRGKGYVSEALKIFTAYMFDSKPINRLEIEVATENKASRKVAEKCGFKYEGLKRQAAFSRGKYRDIEVFSLLRHECPNLQEVLSIKS